MLFSEWCRCNIHQQGATESESFQQNLDPSVVWVSKKIKIKHTLKKRACCPCNLWSLDE